MNKIKLSSNKKISRLKESRKKNNGKEIKKNLKKSKQKGENTHRKYNLVRQITRKYRKKKQIGGVRLHRAKKDGEIYYFDLQKGDDDDDNWGDLSFSTKEFYSSRQQGRNFVIPFINMPNIIKIEGENTLRIVKNNRPNIDIKFEHIDLIHGWIRAFGGIGCTIKNNEKMNESLGMAEKKGLNNPSWKKRHFQLFQGNDGGFYISYHKEFDTKGTIYLNGATIDMKPNKNILTIKPSNTNRFDKNKETNNINRIFEIRFNDLSEIKKWIKIMVRYMEDGALTILKNVKPYFDEMKAEKKREMEEIRKKNEAYNKLFDDVKREVGVWVNEVADLNEFTKIDAKLTTNNSLPTTFYDYPKNKFYHGCDYFTLRTIASWKAWNLWKIKLDQKIEKSNELKTEYIPTIMDQLSEKEKEELKDELSDLGQKEIEYISKHSAEFQKKYLINRNKNKVSIEVKKEELKLVEKEHLHPSHHADLLRWGNDHRKFILDPVKEEIKEEEKNYLRKYMSFHDMRICYNEYISQGFWKGLEMPESDSEQPDVGELFEYIRQDLLERFGVSGFPEEGISKQPNEDTLLDKWCVVYDSLGGVYYRHESTGVFIKYGYFDKGYFDSAVVNRPRIFRISPVTLNRHVVEKELLIKSWGLVALNNYSSENLTEFYHPGTNSYISQDLGKRITKFHEPIGEFGIWEELPERQSKSHFDSSTKCYDVRQNIIDEIEEKLDAELDEEMKKFMKNGKNIMSPLV